ncbi:MAG: hypothetical protein E2O52_04250 [Gammaproteobacteria bacterium]|nr:MAG: hypothetical protein E2O52_04250 [Gammaproteobacteria bacterium]
MLLLFLQQAVLLPAHGQTMTNMEMPAGVTHLQCADDGLEPENMGSESCCQSCECYSVASFVFQATPFDGESRSARVIAIPAGRLPPSALPDLLFRPPIHS